MRSSHDLASSTFSAGLGIVGAAPEAPDYLAVSVGTRLRNKRMLCGLSREQLAQKLQIDPEDVRAYEKGATRISANQLLRAADVLGVRPTYFFRFSDERPGAAAENN